MKQHPTLKEWKELPKEQRIEIFKNIQETSNNADTLADLFAPNIGQMLEYLGDEWNQMVSVPTNDELCNAIFEAVKQKSNEKQKDKMSEPRV